MMILTVFLFVLFCLNPSVAGANECLKGDCDNGYGLYLYNSGAYYAGQWRNGKRHGYGIWIVSDGSEYSGDWKNGRMDGSGVKIYTDGSMYTGTWKNSDKHGYGIMTYPNGAMYTGEWKKNKMDGYGTKVYADGSVYTGRWEKGNRYKMGILLCADGSEYVGGWTKESTQSDKIWGWQNRNGYPNSIVAKVLNLPLEYINRWERRTEDLPISLYIAFECLYLPEKDEIMIQADGGGP